MSDDPKHLPATTPPAAKSAAAPRQRLLWVAIILLLLALVALAVFSAFQWQQRQAMEQQLQQRLSQLSESVTAVGDQRQSVESQVTDRLRRLESGQEKIDEQQQDLQRKLDQAARSLLQMGNRTRNDWLLAEAEYLIRIANQRLQMERDIGGALALLESADDVLEEADDLGAYPVRQQLAREIQSLKAIEDIDRIGLYLQLEAAIEQVDKLSGQNLRNATPLDTMAGTGAEAGTDGESAADTAAEQPIQQAWQSFKQTLSEVVVIRRLDEPVKPLLSPRQSAYANLNLRLMLEEAEMALLSAEPTLYQRSLEKAQEWLTAWYDDSDNTVAALQDTLEELQQKEIKPDLPDISESLNLLKARINGRMASQDPDDAQTQQPQDPPQNSGQGSDSES